MKLGILNRYYSAMLVVVWLITLCVLLLPTAGRAHYLNPDTGRFWTMDTYEGIPFNPPSLHKYLFVSDNPVNRIDPSGHEDLTLPSVTFAGSFIAGGAADVGEAVTARAFSWATFRTVTAAVAIGAELSGDKNQNVNVMRLQLQEGTKYHYWSVPITWAPNPGVTRKQVQLTLGVMFSAVELQDALQAGWDKFDFSKNEAALWQAIRSMSVWVGTHGPTDNLYYTVHQEYLHPTDTTGARIDLENIRGINLRQ